MFKMDTNNNCSILKCFKVWICVLLLHCNINSVSSYTDLEYGESLSSENYTTTTASGRDSTFTEQPPGATETMIYNTIPGNDLNTGSEHKSGNITTVANIGNDGHNTSLQNQTITEQHEMATVTHFSPTSRLPLITDFFTLQTMIMTHSVMVVLFKPDIDQMEDFMEDRIVTNYLDKYSNNIKRSIVRNQLKHCPYDSLCDLDSFAIPSTCSCCKSCSCETLTCASSNNCCPSIIPSENFTLVNITEPNTLKSFNYNVGTTPICLPVVLSHQTEDGFMGVAGCPDNVSKELKDLCTAVYSNESLLVDIVPVYDNITKQIFRNKYCAICNQVPGVNILSFITNFSCDNQTEFLSVKSIREAIVTAFSNLECELAFFTKHLQLDNCDYVIDKCNVTGKWQVYDPIIEHGCSMYTSQVKNYGTHYKNINCALCNGITPDITCCTGDTIRSNTFGFAGLLSLETEQAILSTEAPIVKDTKSSCSNDQMFDILFEKCRAVFCPDRTVLNNGACMSMYNAILEDAMYVVEMRLLPRGGANIVEIFDNQESLLDEIYTMFARLDLNLDICDIQMTFKTDLPFSKIEIHQNVNPSVTYIDIKMKLKTMTFGLSHNRMKTSDQILTSRFRPISMNISAERAVEFQVVFTQLDSKLFNVVELFGLSRRFTYVSFHGKNATDRLNILLKYSLSGSDGFTIIPNVHYYMFSTVPCTELVSTRVDILKYSSCPKVMISGEDLKWTDASDGIVVDGLKIDRAMFYYADDLHIFMCVKQYRQLVKHLLPTRAFSPDIIVSIVCNSLSIVSLLVTIVTMVLLPKLRNSLPGHNNLVLALNLMIAQMLYLVGTIGIFEQYSAECKTVALLIHFSWLCVIFWMNVCTFHLYLTLTRTQVPSQKLDGKKCFVYHLYVLLLSSAFVGLNIIISFVQSTGLGYGGKYCYVTSGERILITFVAPTVLVVFANLLMFALVACRVTKTSIVRKSVQNSRNDFIIITKLASITGITWVFGFVYIWTEITVFSYIFTILNAGQGVFIMISFIANGRVMEMFKARFKDRQKSHLTSQSSDQKSKPSSTSSAKL